MSTIAIIAIAISIILVVAAFIVLFFSGATEIMDSTDPYKGDNHDN